MIIQLELSQHERLQRRKRDTIKEVIDMRSEYDFSKGIRNPYTNNDKKQITIRLNTSTIDYFKKQAEMTGISYQNLINMYLTDCAVHEKELVYTIR